MKMKYPSQYEAEALLEAMDAVDNVFVGGCRDSKTAAILEETTRQLHAEFVRVFNSPDTSPWRVVIRGNKRRKRVVSWDAKSACAMALKGETA